MQMKKAKMSFFVRYLTLWVALCIAAGVAFGHFLPGVFRAIGAAEVAHVNLPVAALIWLMIIPMLVRIDFTALGRVREHWRGIGVTLFINWAVKPFSMAALGWLFIGYLFRSYLPADQVDSYIAGLILLAAAPCTAMVFVWSNLSDGEPHFTLSQVALNDTIMVVAYAPIVGLLLGLSAITVPWDTLLISVGLYIVVPVILAQIIRSRRLAAGGEAALKQLIGWLKPISLIALLTTLIVLFGFQGNQIIAQPLVIALIAVPLLIQVYFNSGIAYLLNRATGEAHCIAAPSALIGASNFFELAVATAISLFGFTSGAALATVVGVLIEVPVMLSVVKIVTATKGWYERGSAVQRNSRALACAEEVAPQEGEPMFKKALIGLGASRAEHPMINCLPELKRWGIESVVLAHVIRVGYIEGAEYGHEEEYKSWLDRHANALRNAGVDASVLVIDSGDPAEALLTAAADHDADLVVVGSCSHSFAHRFFLGSVAREVIRRSTLPVLIERIEPTEAETAEVCAVVCEQKLVRILLATDFSEQSRPAEEAALFLASRAAQTDCLTVLPEEVAAKAEAIRTAQKQLIALADKIEASGGHRRALVERGDPAEVIARVGQQGYSLIIVGKHGQDWIAGKIIGSTADEVCDKARRPVLMVP
jgi:ACR3 family arsenite transporter